MEVELVLQGSMSHTALEIMFKKAIAGALVVSIEHVVKLVVKEIGMNTTASNPISSNATNGSRRLLSNQTKRYEVSFSVMVPSSMNPSEVVARANDIVAPGSAAAIAFQQALEATGEVVKVGQIVLTVPFRQVSGQQTAKAAKKPLSDDNDKSWTTVIITSIAIFMVVVSCGSAALVFKRKRVSDAAPSNQAANADLEAGVVPLVGLAPSNSGAVAVAPNPVAGIEASPGCATELVPASADAEAVVSPIKDTPARETKGPLEAPQASAESNEVLSNVISLGDTPVSPSKMLISL